MARPSCVPDRGELADACGLASGRGRRIHSDRATITAGPRHANGDLAATIRAVHSPRLARLRALDANGSYDYNHVYVPTGSVESPRSSNAALPRDQEQNTTRVGLIDSGVEVTQHAWGCEPAIATAHGTAVASLLVGQHTPFAGAAPHAVLYAADVYCGRPVEGSMTHIASALTWMAQQQVPVINISLVGSDNALLKQLVRNLIARGHVIVAAVGNEGPAAPPLYPAAYPEVVGVTAVDARGRIVGEQLRVPLASMSVKSDKTVADR